VNTFSGSHGAHPPAAVIAALGVDPSGLKPLPAMTGRAWLLRARHRDDLVLAPADAVQATAARAAAECDVGPRVVDHVDGWLVCEWLVGTHLTPLELRRPGVLLDLAALLVRWHSCQLNLPVVPMSQSRQQYAAAAGTRVAPALANAIEWADEVEGDVQAASDRWVPAHLDVVANVLSTARGLRLIDFEYARSAPPGRELGQLIWDAELDQRFAEMLVTAYLAARGEPANGAADEVAAAATWCALSAVTWTTWALARQGDGMQRYARRSWERLVSHWARPPGL
jgi:hypothetical protein